MFTDQELGTQQCLSCGGAETDNNFGLNQPDLGFKPGAASGNLAGVGFFVNTSFATGFPFEMLDDVGDVDLRAIDTGLGQRVVK